MRQALSRACVTGGSGFVGQHLVQALRDAGWSVRCAVRASSRTEALEALGAEVLRLDLLDPAALRAGLAGVDAVFHAAAVLRVPWRRSFLSDNARLSRALAQACADQAQPPVLVHVSSMAAAGPAGGATPVRESDPPRPISLYGRSKLAAEQALAAFADRVPIRIARPPMVFGEPDDRSLKLFQLARRGYLPLPHDPRQRLSMLHGADLAALLVRLAEGGEDLHPGHPGHGVYHAAHPGSPTWQEFARLLGDASGCARVRALRIPRAALWASMAAGEVVARARDRPSVLTLDKAREATGGAWVCSTAKIEALGFTPGASLAERVLQTGRWYRAQGWL
ncbi:MAG: NAD(P)-dependent oxidoreductase [Planctomycetota bacterium]